MDPEQRRRATRRGLLGAAAVAAVGASANALTDGEDSGTGDGDVSVLREAPLNAKDSRFGARGDGDASVDDTAAIQRAIDTAYAAGGNVVYIPPGEYRVSSLVREWRGGLTTVNLAGAGKHATVLRKYGSDRAPLIDFKASVDQLETYSDISDLALVGDNRTHDGIRLDAVARLRLRNLDIRNCAAGIRNQGGLVMTIQSCTLEGNADGLINLRSQQSGGPPPNLVVLSGSQFIGNAHRGIDHAAGQMLILCAGTDVESNGTPDDLATGGLFVASDITDDIGYGQVVVRDTWFEGNRGRAIQAAAGDLILDSVNIVSSEAGRAVYARDLRSLAVSRCHLPSPGDSVDADATVAFLSIDNSVVHSLTMATSQRSELRNVQTGTEFIVHRAQAADGDTSLLDVRLSGEPHPRAELTASGRLRLGSGAEPADWELQRTAPNVARTPHRLIFDAGIGVGNASQASSPGAVHSKVPVYDSSGQVLGYLPVYDDIL